MTPELLIIAAIALAVLTLGFSAVSSFRAMRGSRLDVQQRLLALQHVPQTEVQEMERLIEDAQFHSREGLAHRLWQMLRRLLRQALPGVSPRRQVSFAAGVAVAAYVAALLLVRTPLLQVATAIMIWLVVLGFMLQRRRKKRIETALNQLPAALEIMVRSVEAGHPVVSAIGLVGREMAEPIGPEFLRLSSQLTFGAPLGTSVMAMTDRLGVEEVNLLGVTLTVQAQTGGKLSEVLSNLAAVVRERALMQAKIRAITAEGRTTAVIMLCFPFGLYTIVRTMMPDYFDPLWATGFGWVFVGALAVLMAIGVVLLNRIVRVDY